MLSLSLALAAALRAPLRPRVAQAGVTAPHQAGFDAPPRRTGVAVPHRPRTTRTVLAAEGVPGDVLAAESVPGDCTPFITVRETKDRGLGVYATAPIKNGTFLTDYVGAVVPSEQLLRDHPDAEPEYAFRVDEALYIDAQNSTHWSKPA